MPQTPGRADTHLLHLSLRWGYHPAPALCLGSPLVPSAPAADVSCFSIYWPQIQSLDGAGPHACTLDTLAAREAGETDRASFLSLLSQRTTDWGLKTTVVCPLQSGGQRSEVKLLARSVPPRLPGRVCPRLLPASGGCRLSSAHGRVPPSCPHHHTAPALRLHVSSLCCLCPKGQPSLRALIDYIWQEPFSN